MKMFLHLLTSYDNKKAEEFSKVRKMTTNDLGKEKILTKCVLLSRFRFYAMNVEITGHIKPTHGPNMKYLLVSRSPQSHRLLLRDSNFV